MMSLEYLEGRRMCVVFVKVIDESAGKVEVACLHGRADVDSGRLAVVSSSGSRFAVPNTALGNILPSDGTPILKDAEYFVMVKTDSGIDLDKPDYME